jgi:hypothetical protein
MIVRQMLVSHAVSCSWKSSVDMAERGNEELQLPISIVPAPLQWKKRRSASSSTAQKPTNPDLRGNLKLSDHTQQGHFAPDSRSTTQHASKAAYSPSSRLVDRTAQRSHHEKPDNLELPTGDICSSPPQSLPSLVRDSPRASAWSDADSDDFFASPPPVRDLFEGIECSPREKFVNGCVEQGSSPGSRKITSHGVIPLRLPQKVRHDKSPAQTVQLWKSANPRAVAELGSTISNSPKNSSPPSSSEMPMRDKPPLRLQLPRIQTRFDKKSVKHELSKSETDTVRQICREVKDAETRSNETLSPVALHQAEDLRSKSCESLPDDLSKIVVPRTRSPTPGAIKILTSPVQAQLQRRLTGDDGERMDLQRQGPVYRSQRLTARVKESQEDNRAVSTADNLTRSKSLGTSPIIIGSRNVGTAIQQAESSLRLPVLSTISARREQQGMIPELVLSVEQADNQSRDPSRTWYDCRSGMKSAFSSDDGRSFLTAWEGEGGQSPGLPNTSVGRHESENRHSITELEGRQIDASSKASTGERASSTCASSDIYDTNSKPEEPWTGIDTGVRDAQARKRMDPRAIEALRGYARKKRHEVRDQNYRASSPDAAVREQGSAIAPDADHTRSSGGSFAALTTISRVVVLSIYIMFSMLKLGLWTIPCVLLKHFELGKGRDSRKDACAAESILRERKVLRRSSNRSRRKERS